MAIRGGSWNIGGFKLPEFGITEAAQRFLQPNKPTTSQGGSNLIGLPKAQAPAPKPVYGPPAPQRVLPQAQPKSPPIYSPSGTRTSAPTPQQQSQQQQQQSQPEPQQEYQQSFEPSGEDAAARAAEERMRRYNELVAPVQGDIESYLSSRPDIKKLFEQELTTQGIPAKQATLGGFEKDVTNLQGQLETIPTENIARRKETGMLTAAAERRIRSKEEHPIREQLLKTRGAAESERVGLQRAFDLVDKMLNMTREQEKRGLEPLQTRLETAKGEFSNEVEALAARLTGFNKDQEARLQVYRDDIASKKALTLQQQKDAAALERLETQHLNAMAQIAAKKNGTIGDEDYTAEIENVKARIQSGEDVNKIVGSTNLPDEVLQKLLTQEATMQRNINTLGGDEGP